MKEPPQYSALAPENPSAPLVPKVERNYEPIVRSSRDRAAYESYQGSALAVRALQYCVKPCVAKFGGYDKDCMRVCTSKYKEVVEVHHDAMTWYSERLAEHRRRGEVPTILQDQVGSDKAY